MLGSFNSAGLTMQQTLEPTVDPTWVMIERGYDPLRECCSESRFAVANGFLGVRAAREVSRGPMWLSWMQSLHWASWPRTYVAGLFDTPNVEPPVPALVPVADWLRVHIHVNDRLLVLRSGLLGAYTAPRLAIGASRRIAAPHSRS